MKKIIAYLILFAFVLVSCSDGTKKPSNETASEKSTISLDLNVEQDDAVRKSLIIDSPPALILQGTQASCAAVQCGYSWTKGDETIIADSMHPLQMKEYMNTLNAVPDGISHRKSNSVYLEFETEPDKISVRCWNESAWDNCDATAEVVDVTGSTLELKDGSFIYEITAEWYEYENFSGKAWYCFLGNYSELCAYPLSDDFGK